MVVRIRSKILKSRILFLRLLMFRARLTQMVSFWYLKLSFIDLIIVHVINPLNSIKKDFYWNKYILQQEMKWFSKYIKSFETSKSSNLNNASRKPRPEVRWIDDLEITVHWQIEIFKLLYDFIHNPTGKHGLNNKNIHNILMSSDYLGKLV